MNFDPLIDRWTGFSLRERALLGGAVLAAAFMLLDRVALTPLHRQLAAVQSDEQGAQRELERIRAAVDQSPSSGPASYETALDVRRAAAQAVIDQAETQLVDAQKMRRELDSILHAYPRLRLIGMKTRAPVPLGPVAADPLQSGAGAALYEHGMEVTIEGRYVDTIDYLRALERAPYRIYWKELALTVDPASAIPSTKVTIFTISRESTWLSL